MAASEIHNFLASAPEPQRTTLQALRKTLCALLPEAEQCISYGLATFKVGGKGVAGFGFFKNHCSYFPYSGSVLNHLTDDLKNYTQTKGSLHFPIDHPLDDALVKRLVEVRLHDIATRKVTK